MQLFPFLQIGGKGELGFTYEQEPNIHQAVGEIQSSALEYLKSPEATR